MKVRITRFKANNPDLTFNDVNRVEVIDQTGRAYTHYLRETESVRYSLQDDNRTLKIFIDMNGSVARDDQ